MYSTRIGTKTSNTRCSLECDITFENDGQIRKSVQELPFEHREPRPFHRFNHPSYKRVQHNSRNGLANQVSCQPTLCEQDNLIFNSEKFSL